MIFRVSPITPYGMLSPQHSKPILILAVLILLDATDRNFDIHGFYWKEKAVANLGYCHFVLVVKTIAFHGIARWISTKSNMIYKWVTQHATFTALLIAYWHERVTCGVNQRTILT